jgi:hypothetical protein
MHIFLCACFVCLLTLLVVEQRYGLKGPLHTRNMQFRAYLRMERAYVARLQTVVNCYQTALQNELR